jgi:hypothetical protein
MDDALDLPFSQTHRAAFPSCLSGIYNKSSPKLKDKLASASLMPAAL